MKKLCAIDAITEEQFTDAITDVAHEHGVEGILAVPGVFEILREHFNNDAIDFALEDTHTQCDECCEWIPNAELETASAYHTDECPLFPENTDGEEAHA